MNNNIHTILIVSMFLGSFVVADDSAKVPFFPGLTEIKPRPVLKMDDAIDQKLRNENVLSLSISALRVSCEKNDRPETYVLEMRETLYGLTLSTAVNIPHSLGERMSDDLVLAALYGCLRGELMRIEDIVYEREHEEIFSVLLLHRLRSLVKGFPLTLNYDMESKYICGYGRRLFSTGFPGLDKATIVSVFEDEFQREIDLPRRKKIGKLLETVQGMDRIPSLRAPK